MRTNHADVVAAARDQALSIGSVVGGRTPANEAWRKAISDFARNIASAQGDMTSPLNLNVVFHVPGGIVQPGYEGVRTGGFSEKDSLLMLQVALPETAPDDPGAYLRAAGHAAIDEAERWAEGKGRSVDLEPLRELIRRA